MIDNLPIIIIAPVYNDWTSFHCLLQDLSAVASLHKQPFRILAVDDGSFPLVATTAPLLSPYVLSVETVRLVKNFGHQRAIAIGLVEAGKTQDYEAIIVMDADGEDPPSAIPLLIDKHRECSDHIVLAVRGKRFESRAFRLLYVVYKVLAKLLIGQRFNFGNYCLIPASQLDRLIYDPNLWNHLAATVARGSFLVERIRVDRGLRYDGHSKMNVESLIMHGLSAISVFVDIVFLRMLILSSAIAGLGILGIGVVLVILLFTRLAIPGWATNAVGILSIIVFQALIFSAGTVFFILSRRSGSMFIPALDAVRFIKERKEMLPHD